jgi:hypothetical protein
VSVPHYYSIAEANAKLPELTTLLEEMRAQAQQLAAVQSKVAETTQKIKGNGYHNPSEDSIVSGLAERIEEQLQEGIGKLARWEIELKDLATGLIDFPALRDGETVYLCWQLGEPEVAFWHETTTGFAGRQPLDDHIR